jgi:hypothetical protein
VTKPDTTIIIHSGVSPIDPSGTANPDLSPNTPLVFCTTLSDTGEVLPYPRLLPDCTSASHNLMTSCVSTCTTGWYCCTSLGNTCVQVGTACPACPDCAFAADPCPGDSFEFQTPTSTRQCCLNEPPSAPPVRSLTHPTQPRTHTKASHTNLCLFDSRGSHRIPHRPLLSPLPRRRLPSSTTARRFRMSKSSAASSS